MTFYRIFLFDLWYSLNLKFVDLVYLLMKEQYFSTPYYHIWFYLSLVFSSVWVFMTISFIYSFFYFSLCVQCVLFVGYLCAPVHIMEARIGCRVAYSVSSDSFEKQGLSLNLELVFSQLDGPRKP